MIITILPLAANTVMAGDFLSALLIIKPRIFALLGFKGRESNT